jgi:DNA ligase (NAD+)
VLRALEDPASTRIPDAPPLGLGDRIEAATAAAEAEATDDASAAGDAPVDLTGATLVFTGSLEGFNRAEAREQAEAAGARVARSLTRRTTCLVVGTRPGTVYEQAIERGVRCIDEAAFVEALSRATGSGATGPG